MAIVYLIHFHQSLHHARHYMGFCEDGNLDARLARHRAGNGSRLMAAVQKAGINWRLVRTWAGVDRHFERGLKNKKNAVLLCPVCRERALARQRKQRKMRRRRKK